MSTTTGPKSIHAQQIEPWSEALEGQAELPDKPLLDEHSLVLAALAKLSPGHRQILDMIYRDDLSLKEIQTAALGYTDGAFQIALKALREALKELLP